MTTNHYIRLNDRDEIIAGFSDKFFSPLPGDILLRENTERHFYLEDKDGNKIYNPPLTDLKGNPCIKYKDGKFKKFKSFKKDKLIPTLESIPEEEIMTKDKINYVKPEGGIFVRAINFVRGIFS